MITSQLQNISIAPQIFLVLICSHSLFPLPCQASMNLLSFTTDLLFKHSHKWNYTVCSYLHLASFT